MAYDNDQNRKGSNSFGKNPTIKSPYNFVPLSETVVCPKWADEVSHDIPFEGGISGEIELKVVLQTPGYIKDSESDSFFKANVRNKEGVVEKKYVIPGTSFKGMIRNVLEIASFGKMQRISKQTLERKYSVRDLSNYPLYGRHFTEQINAEYKNMPVVAYGAKSKAGWLKQDKNGNWSICPCDYARIDHQDLKTYFHGIDFGKSETAELKYRQIEGRENIWFKPDKKDVQEHSKDKNGKRKYLFYEKITASALSNHEKEGYKQGMIVFTGQPSSKKHMEFIFYKEPNGESVISVSEDQKNDFDFIHSQCKDNSNTITPNPEWAYWKDKLESGEKIPVFYIVEDKEVLFGLAMMFKLPYKYRIQQLINSRHLNKEDHDMAELIFGYTIDENNKESTSDDDEKKSKSLKGRVQFSHFISDYAVDEKCEARSKDGNPFCYALGSPKPTYYPNYVAQNKDSRTYKTFMDQDAQVRGWKRYPSQFNQDQGFWEEDIVPESNVTTTLKPIDWMSFSGKVRFFNLKREELGALLWSLKFGHFGEDGKFFQHKIGMGKPLGFGRITIDIDKIKEIAENFKVEEFVKEAIEAECAAKSKIFEDYISKEVKTTFGETPQIKELLAMSNIRLCWSKEDSKYPSLADREFVKNKNDNKILHSYSHYDCGCGVKLEESNVVVRTAENVKKHYESQNKLKNCELTKDEQKILESLTLIKNNKKFEDKLKGKKEGLTPEERAVIEKIGPENWPVLWQGKKIKEILLDK